LTGGFGTTLASVALLVGLGAMLGRLLEHSGGAQVLADSLIGRFGEKRAPLALGVAALLFGFPIFFDAGLVVFLPIVFTVARRLGGSLLTYGLPVAGAFAVMHAFVPPHPGPVAAAELIGADIGLVLVFGLLIGLPTWYLGGYLFGLWAGRRYDVAVPHILDDDAPRTADETELAAEDLALIENTFRETRFHYMDFLTRESVKHCLWKARAGGLLRPLGELDFSLLNNYLTPLKYLSSYVVIQAVK